MKDPQISREWLEQKLLQGDDANVGAGGTWLNLPVNWEAAFKEERAKFQKETLLTSKLTREKAELEKQLEAEQAYTNKLTSLLKQADEAMAWNLGGEPIDTLMLKARKDIKAVLESTDKLEIPGDNNVT